MTNRHSTVLLTGYAGFIGSQLLRDLIKLNYRVIGIDALRKGSAADNFSDILRNHSDQVTLSVGDIADTTTWSNYLLDEISLGIDFIINCAAESHVDRSWSSSKQFIDSNVQGPVNLAKIALLSGGKHLSHTLSCPTPSKSISGQNTRPEGHRLKKFVQVSTDEVFDSTQQPFNESTAIRPANVYSASKASAEMLLRPFYEAYGLPLVLTNGANTYGHRQYHEKIIPFAIKRLKEGKKVPVYKTPAQRMWLHVEDHSAGIIAAMERGKPGERYCLAPSLNQELFTHDLVGTISELMGIAAEDGIEYVPDRVNYDLRYLMSNKYAKEQLGWNPTREIVKELPDLVTHYREIL